MPDPATVGLAAKLGASGAGLVALSAVWLGQVSAVHGIPERAAIAYVEAGRVEGCDWRDLAAVGWAESGHGTSQVDGVSRSIDAAGYVTPALEIFDVWDWGGGPMGFLRSTWEGGGYSQLGDYQDVDAAAQATCRYLKAKGYDADKWSALKAYNGSGPMAEAYADKTTAYAAGLPADPGGAVPAQEVASDAAGTVTGRRSLGDTLEAGWQWLWGGADAVEAATNQGGTPTLGPITAGLNDASRRWVAPPVAGQQTGEPVEQKPQSSVEGERIAAAARAWVGKEFRPGAREQCAFFVRQVLDEVGLDPGVTGQPFDGWESSEGMANSFGADQGQAVPVDGLQPGDVVMFLGTYGPAEWADDITHVGIYVGDGMIVDRPTASRPVQLRPLSTFEKFGGAVRLEVKP
jgi:cell wall-associated NlpC family hydrolase